MGPKLDPDEEAALKATGAVADKRPQRYLGSSKDCPISEEPDGCPFSKIRLPFAWPLKKNWEIPVMHTG